MTYKNYEKLYLDQMIKIFVNSFNSQPWNDNWTPEIVKKRLVQLINTEGFQGLLCFEKMEEEEKLAGLILGVEEYSFSGKEFVIKELCVDTRIKGKGIGTKLLKEFENRLKIQGYNKITLMTLKNSATLGFYEKQNYKENPNLVYMEKQLTSAPLETSLQKQAPKLKHYIFSDQTKAITYEDDYATPEEAQSFKDLLEKQYGKKFTFIEG